VRLRALRATSVLARLWSPRGWLGVVAVPGQQQSQGNHAEAEDEVEPVVGVIDRHEVGARVLVDEEAVQPENEVDGATGDEEGARQGGRPGGEYANDAERKVYEVVENRHLEDAEEHGARIVPGDLELVVVGRHPRDESEDADEGEHGSDGESGGLDRAATKAGVRGGRGRVLRHDRPS